MNKLPDLGNHQKTQQCQFHCTLHWTIRFLQDLKIKQPRRSLKELSMTRAGKGGRNPCWIWQNEAAFVLSRGKSKVHPAAGWVVCTPQSHVHVHGSAVFKRWWELEFIRKPKHFPQLFNMRDFHEGMKVSYISNRISKLHFACSALSQM